MRLYCLAGIVMLAAITRYTVAASMDTGIVKAILDGGLAAVALAALLATLWMAWQERKAFMATLIAIQELHSKEVIEQDERHDTQVVGKIKEQQELCCQSHQAAHERTDEKLNYVIIKVEELTS